MGPFERHMLVARESDLNAFLDRMDASTLLAIGSLNSRLRMLVDVYKKKAWDFMRFAHRYFRRPGAMLSLIDGRNALIHGEAVLGFFLRRPTASLTIDICTNVASIYHIQKYLEEDGYDLVAPIEPPSMHHAIRSTIHNSLYEEAESWDLTGERSSHSALEQVFLFRYVKGFGASARTVNLRLTRSEPHRFVLDAGFSALSCCMSRERAICPFGYSTFIQKMTFAMPGHDAAKAIVKERNLVVRGSTAVDRFAIVYGPPYDHATTDSRESGARFLGDSHCWIIPRTQGDPLALSPTYHGPAFEVVDWTMLHGGNGAYMRVGEPFVLSSLYLSSVKRLCDKWHT
ncbi:hypothetical protein MD484_g2470, partial [Candolleomyces efflorescens]